MALEVLLAVTFGSTHVLIFIGGAPACVVGHQVADASFDGKVLDHPVARPELVPVAELGVIIINVLVALTLLGGVPEPRIWISRLDGVDILKEIIDLIGLHAVTWHLKTCQLFSMVWYIGHAVCGLYAS